MKITGKGTIYKNEYGYQISDNQKQPDGTYNNFYIPVHFKKDLQEPNDRDYIEIEGFTKPYKTKENKLGISYMITNYNIAKSSGKKEAVKTSKDPFEEFGKFVEVDDNLLD